jgi:hypothetical protein
MSGGQEECVGHPADELKLLPVLLAEVSVLSPRELQQLEDHGQHGVEVPGPVRTLERRERSTSETRYRKSSG